MSTTTPPAAVGTPCTCANCTWRGDIDQTKEVRDFWSRMEPGDTMPAGDCPECGSFAFIDGPPRDLAAEMRGLVSAGLTQAQVLDVLSAIALAADPGLQAFADNVKQNDELEVDGAPLFSESDEGCWVSAWVWVTNEEAGIKPFEVQHFDNDPDGEPGRAGDGWYYKLRGEDGWSGPYGSEEEATEEAEGESE